MAEHEGEVDKDILITALYLAAQEPHGITIKLASDEELRVALSGTGEATLFIASRTPQVSSPARAPAEPQPPAESGATKEADQRVKLRGRIGTEPKYGPLPRRELRVGFRFGAFTESDKPEWHEVYATGQHAKSIQAKNIHKGDEIELVGERQQAQRRLPDGSIQTREVVYAYGVSLKKRAKPHS